MNILITVPSPLEFEKLDLRKFPHIQHLISGVGTLVSFATMAKYFQQNPAIDLIVQAGIAGSFERNAQIGDVVLIQQDAQADLGKIDPSKGWIDIFDFGFDLGFPSFYHSPFLENPYLSAFDPLKLPSKNSVTIQQRNTSSAVLERLLTTYQAQISSMEGFAVHYFGYLYKIPFVQIRAISNDVADINLNPIHIKHSLDQLKTTLHQLISIYYDLSPIIKP